MMFTRCKKSNIKGRAVPVVNSLADAMATTSCLGHHAKASLSNNSASRSIAPLASGLTKKPNEHLTIKPDQLQIEQVEVEINKVVVIESISPVNNLIFPKTTNLDTCSLDFLHFTFTSPSTSGSSSESLNGKQSNSHHHFARSHSMFIVPESKRSRHHHRRLRQHQQQKQCLVGLSFEN